MPRFEALSRAEQHYEVEGALPVVLADITRATPTAIIVARVARAIDADPAYVNGLVQAIARRGHPQARQDGEVFMRYGKRMQRWVWYPGVPPQATIFRAAQIAADAPSSTTVDPDWDDDDPRWTEHYRQQAQTVVNSDDW